MSNSVYEKERYVVYPVKYGYDIYLQGLTHAIRLSQIGYSGEIGLQKCKDHIDLFISENRHNKI